MNVEVALIFGAIAVNVGLIYSTYFKKGFVEQYAATSPKAFIWRKVFGVERTVWLMRRVFAPLGIVMTLAFASIMATGVLAA